MNWFHRFFNPHCEHCREDSLESRACKSCETLQQMLNQTNFEKQQLLDIIIEKNKPITEVRTNEEIKPILPRVMPWRVKQAMLEQEDRNQAALLKRRQEELQSTGQQSIEQARMQKLPSIEQLEKQVIEDKNAV